MIRKADRKQKSICLFYYPKKEKSNILQKELAKRLKVRYDTKMDGNEWMEVSSDGIPLCRIKYNGQFLSNADQNLSDEYRSKIADIQDEISTVREYVGLYEHAPQMKADGVSDYRQLAAFGDTVLAATYSEKNGFMFCTWKQNADGDSVFWGDYSPNYEYVKEGDAIINKTYITDCISKKGRVNNGERPKYYVENSHPAIIDSATFGRVQEELARRSGKRKISRKAKTEQGKYSSKYALTELLVCGECKSAYRRCTWTAGGKKKIVWRCINRIEYAKKYCHNSPSVEESILQRAVMAAIMKTAARNTEVLQTLKLHIGMGLAGEKSEDNSIDLQIRIAEIDAEFKKMLDRVSTDTIEAFDEETATRLMNEKSRLQQQLDSIADAEQRRENAKSRLDDIYMILDGIKNRPMEYDDQIVRQLLECVVVDSKEQITVIFKGGLKSVQPLTE